MLLRINPQVHGFVPFGDSLEPSSRWNRYLTGNIFKRTIPSQRSILEMLLPPFMQSDPEGVEGGASSSAGDNIAHRNNNNWASNKPHAVIANGAAVQRVPSGLRVLQKTCRDANVPLFVLHDPRAWGANTHDNLRQALSDVRFAVKQNIIIQAMEQQSGFSRGRLCGRMEGRFEQWLKHTKQDRQQRQDAIRKRQWNTLDKPALEKRLLAHGVIRKEEHMEGGQPNRQYSPAFVDIAQQCVTDEEERQLDSTETDLAKQQANEASVKGEEEGKNGDGPASGATTS